MVLQLGRHLERHAPRALAVVCGDFNMVPKCPIYEFIVDGRFNLRGHSKRKLSGKHMSFLFQNFQDYSGDGIADKC